MAERDNFRDGSPISGQTAGIGWPQPIKLGWVEISSAEVPGEVGTDEERWKGVTFNVCFVFPLVR